MRSTALTCLLISAPVSLVSAAPARDESTERISYSDRGKPPPATPDPGRPGRPGWPGWIELASATPASHGKEFIMVGAGAGTFTQLRLTAASGRPEIHSVRVDYQDGRHKVFPISRVLDAKRRPAYLDLRGPHELAQIVVTTDPRSKGSYVLEANTAEVGTAARR